MNPKIRMILQKAKPWLIYVAIFLILRFTGLLSGISDVANRAMLQTGLMDASTEVDAVRKTFDYDFTLLDADLKPVDFTQFKGKTVFIKLWATWCGPCRAEMPSIQSLYEKTDHDKVVFVMLSLDHEDAIKKVASYVAKHEYTFPVFYPKSHLPGLLQVRTIPTTFVINPKGEVVYNHSGTANYNTEEFKQFLDQQSGVAN